MGIFFDAPVEPDTLTTFVRDVPFPASLGGEPLLDMFPAEESDDNTVDFAEIVRTNRTARYRSFDGAVHVSERNSGSEKRVRLIPLGSSLSMGEYERLQLEFARTGGTRQQALARAIYNDADQLTAEVYARLEQAWGDVLSDGILTIAENGYGATVDYGVPPNHGGGTPIAPGTLWSTVASATPLTDMTSWVDTFIATNGFKPGSALTSQRVIRFLLRSAEVINAITGSAAGRSRVTLAELNDLLDAEGLPALRPAYDALVDVDGVSTRVIPDDRFIYLPPNIADVGSTTWGVTATALELVNSTVSDFSWEDANGIVGVVIKENSVPFRQFTFVDAVAMPVVKDAKRLFIADVA